MHVKANDDGAGKQFMQEMLDVGTSLCEGEFDVDGNAVKMDKGFPPFFPFLKYPSLIVEIKCRHSELYDKFLEKVN